MGSLLVIQDLCPLTMITQRRPGDSIWTAETTHGMTTRPLDLERENISGC